VIFKVVVYDEAVEVEGRLYSSCSEGTDRLWAKEWDAIGRVVEGEAKGGIFGWAEGMRVRLVVFCVINASCLGLNMIWRTRKKW